jgi:replicative DNA helicase
LRSVVGSVLDKTVPAIADAIISRIDLTDIVVRQVDLQSIILRALDEIDITQIVMDRVDVDEIVGKTDLDAVIDRIPMLQIADYIIEEIDLPQIIRESTGGVALDAFTTTRVSAIRADEIISTMVDAVLLRRLRQRERKLTVSGGESDSESEPDSRAETTEESGR